MTLGELAINLPALRDEAKALWGDEPAFLTHDLDGNVVPYVDGPRRWEVRLSELFESSDPVRFLRDSAPAKSQVLGGLVGEH